MQRANRRQARRGSNAVEFALILPILLAIVAGIVDYGWYYSNQLAVIGAVREGTRAGSAAPHAQAEAVAERRTRELLAQAGFDVSVVLNDDDEVDAFLIPGDNVMLRVEARVPYTALTNLLGSAYPNAHVAHMVMRLEDQPPDATEED